MNKASITIRATLLFVFAVLIVSFFTYAVARAYRNMPYTNNIYNVSHTEGNSFAVTVSVFDDKDNKCYVARGDADLTSNPDSVAISCVKK